MAILLNHNKKYNSGLTVKIVFNVRMLNMTEDQLTWTSFSRIDS